MASFSKQNINKPEGKQNNFKSLFICECNILLCMQYCVHTCINLLTYGNMHDSRSLLSVTHLGDIEC